MFACNAQFSMHRGRQCAAPNGLPNAGSGNAPNGVSPGLAAGANVKFYAASCWQNVKICECFLKCAVFNASGAEVSRPHRVAAGWARRCERRIAWPWQRGHCNFLGVVSCWQNATFCECLLEMPSFQCIGGGSVPPPISCRTLGRAARRKARRLALAEA